MTYSNSSKILPNIRLIGLGFQIGVGKDCVADVLCREFGFTRMKFADALKEAVSLIFGWTRESLEDPAFKQTIDPFWEMTPRKVLQLFGTEAVRNNIRQDVWVKALERRIGNLSQVQQLAGVVITDMRFLNEVEAIKSWGGQAVRIIRDAYQTSADAAVTSHKSETELLTYTDWNYVLKNNGTLEDLAESVCRLHFDLYVPRISW